MFFRQMAAAEAPYCLHETNCGDVRFAFMPLADGVRLDVEVPRDAPLTPAGMERMLRINRGLAA